MDLVYDIPQDRGKRGGNSLNYTQNCYEFVSTNQKYPPIHRTLHRRLEEFLFTKTLMLPLVILKSLLH